jgi:hypothetical protein
VDDGEYPTFQEVFWWAYDRRLGAGDRDWLSRFTGTLRDEKLSILAR